MRAAPALAACTACRVAKFSRLSGDRDASPPHCECSGMTLGVLAWRSAAFETLVLKLAAEAQPPLRVMLCACGFTKKRKALRAFFDFNVEPARLRAVVSSCCGLGGSGGRHSHHQLFVVQVVGGTAERIPSHCECMHGLSSCHVELLGSSGFTSSFWLRRQLRATQSPPAHRPFKILLLLLLLGRTQAEDTG